MGIWDAIVIVAILGISAELVKSLFKTHTKSKTVSKDELAEFRDAISTMRADLDEIKADVRTVVIQMDDIKLYESGASVIGKRD